MSTNYDQTIQTPGAAPQPLPPRRVIDSAEQARRQRAAKRWAALKLVRSPFMTMWKSLAEHIRPTGFREFRLDVNRGENKFGKIINSTPLEALRTLGSGMMASNTSPSRPWFRLTVPGSDARESPAVKDWLGKVEGVLLEDFANSNVYSVFHLTYLDLGAFGGAASMIDEDDEDGMRGYHFICGSFALATSPRGEVDTIMRELTLTVDQCARLFGPANLSQSTRALLQNGELDKPVNLIHAIYPNDDHAPQRLGRRAWPWASCWWEADVGDAEGFARESGYFEKPFTAPRWEVVGEDVYGVGPGHAALGDCKSLQHTEKKSAQVVEKIANPPMQGPPSVANTVVRLIPGYVNPVDQVGERGGLRPAYEIQGDVVTVLDTRIQRLELQVQRAFFANLWLLLSGERGDGDMTAREVEELSREKLLQLGPVASRFNDESLDPIIDRAFSIALRRGRIPPPPPELQGQRIKVEYISMMQAAQKLMSTAAIERLTQFVATLAAVFPQGLDKIDIDQVIDSLADALNVPPALIRPEEAVEAMRQARAEQAAQAQQQMQQQQQAETAETLSKADTGGENALADLLREQTQGGVGAARA